MLARIMPYRPGMEFDDSNTTRRVCPDALAEAEELVSLLREVKPGQSDREPVETVGRAFGWTAGTVRSYFLRLFFSLRSSEDIRGETNPHAG